MGRRSFLHTSPRITRAPNEDAQRVDVRGERARRGAPAAGRREEPARGRKRRRRMGDVARLRLQKEGAAAPLPSGRREEREERDDGRAALTRAP